MSITSRLPANTNFLSKNRFRVVFPRAPKLEYFSQGIKIPTIEVMPVKQPTPFNALYSAGINTKFNPVGLNIICDEDMVAWQEIHDWIIGYSFPREFKEYVEIKKRGLYADMKLLLLSNANQPTLEFTFIEAFPINLGAPDMIAEDDTGQYVTFPVLFRYDDFKIRRIKTL